MLKGVESRVQRRSSPPPSSFVRVTKGLPGTGRLSKVPLLSRYRRTPNRGHSIAHTSGQQPTIFDRPAGTRNPRSRMQEAMSPPFDDRFASLFSKMLTRLARPADQAHKPTPKMPARGAIRSVRLTSPAGRIPLRLACAAGAASPATGLLWHVRLWPHAPLTPAFRKGWRQSPFIAQRVQIVAHAGIPLEWGGAIRPPNVPVLFPRPRAVGETRAFGQTPFIGSRWRIAEPETAEPVQFLANGSNLPACEYRTRSML